MKQPCLPFDETVVGEWARLEKRPQIESLYGVHFISEQLGWAVGAEGTVLHTTDGGYRWVKQNARVRGWLRDVFFIDERVGWVVGWNDWVLRTQDGGHTWLRTPNK